MIKGKTIILGVTGCIAAYKAAEIARRLIEAGAVVKVVMTEAATRFITPLTFRILTRQPVVTSLFDEEPAGRIHHISLAREADLVLVAPATANILAKVAHGIADDILSTTLLSTDASIVFAPAMNAKMYLNPITQRNLSTLADGGFVIIEPTVGELACGEEGIGRLAEVGEIVSIVEAELLKVEDLKGKTIFVTAGGTREPLDPVRFLGNRSSGKMGYAIADSARRRGAKVTLISAPTQLRPPWGVEFIPIGTALEMHDVMLERFDQADAVVMAAAASDFRPASYSQSKIKKGEAKLELKLERSPDILEELGKRKKGQVLVGFAAESENLIENALGKLKGKNLDLIVVNDITKPGSGFGEDSNEAVLIDAQGRSRELPLMPKAKLARLIVDELAKILKNC
ncbi:MAG: bifunctional phosphopantothenoylcysteine decarboxylase/phosphopantothenate--cysteine ligase CoaBC [Actinomycetota bacterium]|nr:bifunctional phosphopantothenoylcysteine decarboxylase/phosphopantothenate--cysteine ligase CoaBC [Actinomycetota bacterium]